MKTKTVENMKTVKYFYGKAIKYRPTYIVFILLNIIQNGCAPFVNIIIPKYIIDELIGNRNVKMIAMLVSLLIILNGLFSVIGKFLSYKISVCEDYIKRCFELIKSDKMMSLSYENTENPEIMDLHQKAEKGMSWYSGGISGISSDIVKICSSFITLLGIIAVVFSVSVWLLIVSIAVVIINSFVSKKIKEIDINYANKLPFVNKCYYYYYIKIASKDFAKDLKLYDAENIVLSKAKKTADDMLTMDMSQAKENTRIRLIGLLAGAANYIISYGYLGFLALSKLITIGEFSQLVYAIDTFTNNCLTGIITGFQEINRRAVMMKAYIDFLNLPNTKHDGLQPIEKYESTEIEFKNVSFKYPETDDYILKNVNIKIHNNERVAIVGANGAGKTTFIKLLCRMYDVTQGEILLNGINVNNYDYKEYQKLITSVFQDFKLLSVSLGNNITSFNDINESFLNEISNISGVKDFLDTHEQKYDTLLYRNYDETGVEPSGGEQQKIAIARALYKGTPIVILDEPTAALDPIAEYEIYNHFHNMVKNKTAIYISHRLSACRFCSRILVFAGGGIQEDGSHDELMKLNGVYANMFNIQANQYLDEQVE